MFSNKKRNKLFEITKEVHRDLLLGIDTTIYTCIVYQSDGIKTGKRMSDLPSSCTLRGIAEGISRKLCDEDFVTTIEKTYMQMVNSETQVAYIPLSENELWDIGERIHEQREKLQIVSIVKNLAANR